MKKKMIALMLIGAMTVSMITGCGSSATSVGSQEDTAAGSETAGSEATDDGDKVTIHICSFDPAGTDDEMVEQALSEIPEVKELGVNIDFIKYPNGAYNDKSALALTSDEPIDIIFDAGWIAYNSRVAAGAYLDLTDMLNETPELKETIPDALWEGVKVNGGIYGVPTYKELGEQWGVYMESDFIKENNIDISDIHCLADTEKLLESLKGTDRAGFEIYGNTTDIVKMYEMEKYYILNGGVAASMDDTDTLINYYASDDFKQFCTMMHDWYNKGYISEDVPTRENYDEYDKNGNFKMGMTYVSYSPQNEVAKSAEYGKDLTFIPTTGVTVSTSACTGSLYAVCAKSEHPELALKFLELWNTVPAIKNMICYGIEGVHYNMENGQVKRVDGYEEKWNGQNWTTGNEMISYTTVGETEDKWDQYEKFNEQGKKSCFLGFSVDDSTIEDKVSVVTATISEYLPLLNCGAVDPEECLPKFLSALDDAGMNDIVAEYQKQYDEWKNK